MILDKLFAKLTVIVYLSVENDNVAPVCRMDRLIASGKIDYAQPSEPESYMIVNKSSRTVRSAVRNGLSH